MNIIKSIDALIGNTPLFMPKNYIASTIPGANILCKLEYLNPAGSVKDRAALYMINDAESRGLLREGSVIIEPTSGNTGIGLAAIGVSRGYKVILTMPESMSVERRRLLAAYGAEIVLTPADDGMRGAIAKAEEIAAATPGAFIPGQFDNKANPDAHYATTAPEIWRDTDGKIDIFVSGVGTGGTLIGNARYFKERNPKIKIIAVEPAASPLISQGRAGAHGLQGIGANFVPSIYKDEENLCDEVLTVSDEDAYAAARALAKREGILTGITSGAALHAAAVIAGRRESAGKTIVALLPDGGDKYLSTPLYN